MTPDRFFGWFLLAALACLIGLGVGRGLMLYRRGVRVLVIDRHRSTVQMILDLILVLCFFLWAYEILAYAYPLLTHFLPAWMDHLLIQGLVVKVVGGILVLAGLSIYTLALKALADSWRLGIDRQFSGVLVTRGIFNWTRNPIFLSLDLLAIGSFLVLGRLVFLVLGLTLVGLLHEQIRREEIFLSQVYDPVYQGYCAQVGRYIKWW
jgi:protein-S-isoprenylcysteine O-methyltransferase Ste14